MRLNAWLRSAAESAIGTAKQARFQPDARRSLLVEEKQALRRHDCAPAMTLIDDINHSGPADDRAMGRKRPNYLEMLLGMQNLCVGDSRARLSRSEEHTSELQSLMRNSYAVFCLQK